MIGLYICLSVALKYIFINATNLFFVKATVRLLTSSLWVWIFYFFFFSSNLQFNLEILKFKSTFLKKNKKNILVANIYAKLTNSINPGDESWSVHNWTSSQEIFLHSE